MKSASKTRFFSSGNYIDSNVVYTYECENAEEVSLVERRFGIMSSSGDMVFHFIPADSNALTWLLRKWRG